MNRSLFFLGFLLLVQLHKLDGQPTYLQEDFRQVGDTFLLSTANLGLGGFDFAATGEDFSWDFSDLPVGTQRVERVLPAEEPGYRFTWCLNNGIIFGCNSAFAEVANQAQFNLDSLVFGGLSVTNFASHFRLANNVFEESLRREHQCGWFPIAVGF